MRQGQPGVERPEWYLDREGDKEGEEQRPRPALVERELATGDVLLDRVEIGGWYPGCVAVEQVQRDDPQQHKDRSGEGVEEEFDRRAHPAGAAPDADQQRNR